jgi:hypothetical protein
MNARRLVPAVAVTLALAGCGSAATNSPTTLPR